MISTCTTDSYYRNINSDHPGGLLSLGLIYYEKDAQHFRVHGEIQELLTTIFYGQIKVLLRFL